MAEEQLIVKKSQLVVVPCNPLSLKSTGTRKASRRAEPYQRLHEEQSQPSQSQLLSSLSSSTRSHETREGTRSRWRDARELFLRNVPKTSEWRERQIRMRLVNVEEYEKTIQAFTSHGSANLENCANPEDVYSELVNATTRFALLTKSSLANANLQTSFSNFQALLLLSLCAVLERIGVPYETVDRITQYITTAEEYQRRRLRRSAVWINRLISELSRCGWTIYRATELFFINELSVTSLRYIRHQENFDCILNHLTMEEFLKCTFSDCLRPAYSIPGLIAHLFSTANLVDEAHMISIDEICVALGYNPACIPRQLERIHEILPPTVSHHFRSGTAAPGSASMLPLFYAMGGYVPKVLFDHAISLQRRADEHGRADEATPHDARLQQDLMDLLFDDTKLKQTIEHLASLSLISTQKLDGEVYVCLCEPAQLLYEQSREHWICQAFILCCSVFRRISTLHSSFESVERKLSGIVRHLLRLSTEIGLVPPSCDDMLEMLLLASRFGPLGGRIDLLIMAARLQEDTAQTYLHAQIIYQRSVLLRIQGHISDSEHLIQEYLTSQSANLNLIPDYILGLLRLSQANNRAYYFDFGRAYAEALKWQPSSNALSKSQMDAVWDQLCCAGRILRGQGRFDEAQSLFESCMATDGLRESKRPLIKSHLADLYCELQHMQSKRSTHSRLTPHMSFLEKARGIVQPEIEYRRSQGKQSKGLRRLLLSFAEIEIMRNEHENAKRLIMELLDVYNRLTEPDICDRLGHVRSLIAWARLSPLSEAEGHWQAALLQNRVYNPFEEEVFTCGVIYLSIAAVRIELGNIDGGKDSLHRAIDIFNKKEPNCCHISPRMCKQCKHLFLTKRALSLTTSPCILKSFNYVGAESSLNFPNTTRETQKEPVQNFLPLMTTSRSRLGPKAVHFGEQLEVQYIEPSPPARNSRRRRSHLKMEEQVYKKYAGEQVTETMLQEAAVLFSENYGVWGEQATGKFAIPGSRVRLSKDRLRSQYLPNNAKCVYVRVTVDGQLAGNAFACYWTVKERIVCWITQLVVDRNYRERGLAKGLLNQLKQNDVDIYGLMSSHPAACLAAVKAFGDSIRTLQLGPIGKYAKEIMEASPISYVKDAKLRGSVFNPGETSGLVSSVDSEFFVDHTEPLEALAWVREETEWPLGELFDGHEFLIILEARHRSRSRSTSRPKSSS